MTPLRTLALALAAGTIGLSACKSSTTVTTSYSASLSGAKENPAVTTTGSGTFTASVDASNVLTYSLSFSGLSANSSGAHIHGPATTTQNAGVLVNFTALPSGGTATTPLTLGATSGTTAGTLNLASAVNATVTGDSLRKLLDLGLLYVNVHTTANPGGEIRGQIARR